MSNVLAAVTGEPSLLAHNMMRGLLFT